MASRSKERELDPEWRKKNHRGLGIASRTADKDIMRLQAMMIMARRVQGASLTDLEKEFDLSRQSILNRVKLAKRENLLTNAADQVVNELLPLALGVFKKALAEEGNIAVARDVLYGAGILSKGNKAQIAPITEAAPGGPPTLDEIRARYLDFTDTLEGEVIPQKQLPPGVVDLGDFYDDEQDSAHRAGAAGEDQDHEE